ncbi:hydrogenase [Ginsengibacter hankyongi]|uniref:Hydrogenase n=1 Tax=Ginsengibacter hankyongi TaxID=2607284 RepID=A0A5J5IIS0_9BACT|nr:proton-conducting transporter membrane subunit [Ginsengibacter hankyongi]KAA9040929.1 hydrogenase [Ginsengibacter hankyongi]
MYALIISLFILPVAVSVLVLILPKNLSRILVIASAAILSVISFYLLVSIEEPFHFGVSHYMNEVVSVADILLLLYFGSVAIRKKSWLVGLLTVLQFGALLYLLKIIPEEYQAQFTVDKLSVFMFLLINVISGIISIFSLQYIDGEDCSAFRKKYFLSILFWFIAVMNIIVSSDNMECFFLFFELTTLASFLFIGFRKDEISGKNALTALWMNQIGGLAILGAIFFIIHNGYGTATFSNLLAHSSVPGILLPLALLCVAALVKGAQMPFSKWLLGAMVAPTPVSALLHSSTMVKIAPFIILRLSPALKGTPVASVVIAMTGFVFVAAAIGALSQDNFKRILAHSTIALLALMIMMAAVGTPVTIIAALTLVFFHGLSKCMLFLNAGILERIFHFKQTSDMDKLAETGPFTSLVISIGFMSLLLPPFGAFMGKWFGIESLGVLAINQKMLGAFVIVAIACGGAILSLLYFKVLGLLIARTGDHDGVKFEKTKPLYSATISILLGLIILSVLSYPFLMSHYFVPVASQTLSLPIEVTIYGWKLHVGAMALPVVPLLIAFLLLPITIITATFIRFKNVDRVKEYACGEKTNYSFSSFYFATDRATPYFSVIGILFFITLIVVSIL